MLFCGKLYRKSIDHFDAIHFANTRFIMYPFYDLSRVFHMFKGLVFNNIKMKWQVKVLVFDNITLKWQVKGLVFNNIPLKWQVKGLVFNNITMKW
jgi:hypothetical protein